MSIVTTAYPVAAAVMKRQSIERRVASRLVTDLLAAGYTLAVAQGDETPEAHTRSKRLVMRQLGCCDNDRIMVYAPDNLPPMRATGNEHPATGWVYLVYGNDGWDVINDYTTNLEAALAGAIALAATLDPFN